ncbi:MAG: uncharacterized protein QOD77_1988 [Thermoplasmata archaeon]|jgi:uncharacterized protein YyaL (SSP411 family)|nr:uncharacterized protein [Thermoplasmata archaeon]
MARFKAADGLPAPKRHWRRPAAVGVANRLASEPSPYLRQHADNPVEWWPWGEAAFAEARRRDVPVFLSIGYATCHWCHVMAHESFEDAEVARRMNEAFVCVKVDREERPDLDDAYMAACQLMTGAGGWPLTVLLTHGKKPFFAGTYFPKETRHGRIGMMDLPGRVAEAWRAQRKELEAQADHLMLHVTGEPHGHDDEPATQKPAALDLGVLRRGGDALAARFDPEHGGFGGSPKFPSPHILLFLLRLADRGDAEAEAMVVATLEKMAAGGVRDHLGGGFHRYSTDPEWRLPHFEKMLYDQAMLAMAYVEAHQRTGRAGFAEVARSTLDYVLRDLHDPAGGFRCAEDADSEGEEGTFYLWRRDEILAALGPRDGAAFCQAYGVTAEGNFLDEATKRRTGANVLHRVGDVAGLEAAHARLAAVRAKRERPLLDDKVLTDWNGLALAAFAKAAVALAEPRYAEAATRAAAFLRDKMRQPDGRLRHRHHHGQADEVAFLDDHAFLLWGLVELYGATFDAAHLAWAVEVAGQLEARFLHPSGAFQQAPKDADELGAARREAYDGALPSGNSAAAYALHKLGLLTGEPRWTRLANGVADAFAAGLAASPPAYAMMLCALDLALGPTREAVVAGTGPDADAMVRLLQAGHAPRTVVLRATPALAKAAPWTKEHLARGGAATAYVCEGHACKAPATDLRQLREALAGPAARPTPPSRPQAG